MTAGILIGAFGVLAIEALAVVVFGLFFAEPLPSNLNEDFP